MYPAPAKVRSGAERGPGSQRPERSAQFRRPRHRLGRRPRGALRASAAQAARRGSAVPPPPPRALSLGCRRPAPARRPLGTPAGPRTPSRPRRSARRGPTLAAPQHVAAPPPARPPIGWRAGPRAPLLARIAPPLGASLMPAARQSKALRPASLSHSRCERGRPSPPRSAPLKGAAPASLRPAARRGDPARELPQPPLNLPHVIASSADVTFKEAVQDNNVSSSP